MHGSGRDPFRRAWDGNTPRESFYDSESKLVVSVVHLFIACILRLPFELSSLANIAMNIIITPRSVSVCITHAEEKL